MNSKWLNINEGVAYKGIINYANGAEQGNKQVGKYLFKSQCKWDVEIRNIAVNYKGETVEL